MPARAAVILAAGQGTRMKSPTPKVLHPVAGRTMLDHAIDTAQALGCERVVVVVGAHSPEVGAAAEKRGVRTALQDPPLGTGHAVLAAKGFLDEALLPGWGSFDSPLGFHPDRNLLPGVEISAGSLGHGLPLAVGTALWAIAFVMLVPFSGRLKQDGHLWWMWTCVAGFGLGLVGWDYCRRRRNARQAAQQD